MDSALWERGVAAVVALIVIASVAPGVAAVDRTHSATSADLTQVDSGDEITLTQAFALTPDRPGEVNVTLTYRVPDRVVTMETRVPADANVTGADGFDRVNGTTFEWDGRTDTATIAYRVDPNETVERSGPEGADGTYLGADAGEWALFSRSQTPTQWQYTGTEPMGFRRNLTTVGPGATGEWLVYLGPGQTFETTASNQTFTLYVPDRATTAERPTDVLDALANASDSLRVGERDESVFVLAAPTDGVDWAVRGLQTGESDLWVRDTERLDTAENIWVHEYVHSRQSFSTTPETRWITEGSAVYYAALLALEGDRIEFDAFRERLGAGGTDEYAGVVLTDPATWTADANYYKGPLVAGSIDRRIRLDTERERTFQDVVRLLNGLNRRVTQEAFLAAVERAGGSDAAATGTEYTETAASASVWNETAHARVFGRLPARIGYALPMSSDARGYRVSGPYRTDSPVGGPGPIRLATGERLAVEALVSNAGGTAGSYNATLAVNDTTVAAERGRIGPGENRVVPLAHTFDTAGRYRLSIDGDNVTVLVDRPVSARVESVEVSSRDAVRGETVVVTATVVNDADVPAESTVAFRRDRATVTRRTVRLAPNDTTRVSAGVQLTAAGTVSLTVDEAQPVEVTVSPATATATPTSTTRPAVTQTANATGESGGGFTAVAALVALAAAALLAWRPCW